MSYNLTDAEYKHYYTMLTYYGYPEHVASEAIVKATISYSENFDTEFKTHLINVVKNEAIDDWRKNKNKIKYTFDNPMDVIDEVQNAHNSFFNVNLEKEEQDDRLDAVYEVLARLREKCKKGGTPGGKNIDKYKHFIMYYSNDLTFAQLSEKLNITEKTLRVQIYRVRGEIVNYLKKYNKIK